MAQLTNYKNIQVVDGATGDGGQALTGSLKTLADRATLHEDATNPGTGHDEENGFQAGSRWRNTSTGAIFVCTDASEGAAVWVELSRSGHLHTESQITDLGAYLENVVEDTTPQLGGDLDAATKRITNLGAPSGANDAARKTEVDGVQSSLTSHTGNSTIHFTQGAISITASQVSDFTTAADGRIAAQKGAANGLATLGANAKVPTSQLPALALTDVFVVATQAQQLGLTAEEGDVAVRTDLNKSYIHNGGTAGTMADWQELLTPGDAVLSVNGQTGAVTLTTANIAEGANLYYTSERVDDRVAALIQNASGITWTYNDAAGTLTPAVNHDALPNFVANEHVDHTAVSVSTTAPLSGGGSIAANRTLALAMDSADLGVNGSNQLYVKDAGINHNALANYSANQHFLQTAITNVSTSLSTGLLKVTTGTGALSTATAGTDYFNQPSQINHNALTNYSANQHIDWTSSTANLLTTGKATIGGVADAVQLKVKGNASQTADYLQLADSADAAFFNVSREELKWTGGAGHYFEFRLVDTAASQGLFLTSNSPFVSYTVKRSSAQGYAFSFLDLWGYRENDQVAGRLGAFGICGNLSGPFANYIYLDSTSTADYANAFMKIDRNWRLGLGIPSTARPAVTLDIQETAAIAGAVTDGYSSTVSVKPTYSAESAQTVTRHNYLQLLNPTLTNVTVTNACVMRFDAAAGTHKAVDAGTTKATPGGVNAWMKININGTVYYLPAYTSKTA